uniref:Amino acid transporter transmembrane domain-containing protein n=1 Tax=Timema tahoe TaxID=61484 RepID=A0A7R9I963_9NEOP|nr:unnamed protein product [Timema tahoe]
MAAKNPESIQSSTLSIIQMDDFNSTDLGVFAHLLKGSLGTGILAMPNAFKNAGTVFGMVFTLIIGVVCTHCVHILVHSAHVLSKREKIPSLSYADTAEIAFKSGPPELQRLSTFSRSFVNIALAATYYSALCVYIVFIATAIKQVADYHYPLGTTADETINIRLYILMLVPFLYALGLIRNLKYLVPFSALANVFILVGFCITLYYMFTDIPDTSDKVEITSDFSTLPVFFSTVIFAMEGIGVVMPLENSMKNPGHFLGCPGILNIAMLIVVGLYAIIGLFGYLKYGDGVDASVTLNLPLEDILAQVVKILIAAAILFSYGLQFFVPTDICWPMVEKHVSEGKKNILQNVFRLSTITATGYPPSPRQVIELIDVSEGKKNILQNVFRLSTITATVAVAIAVPNLGPIISLVGAVCFSTLGLLCPAVIETATHWENGLGKFRWVLWKNVVIIFFSLLALITGAYTSILEIIKEY